MFVYNYGRLWSVTGFARDAAGRLRLEVMDVITYITDTLHNPTAELLTEAAADAYLARYYQAREAGTILPVEREVCSAAGRFMPGYAGLVQASRDNALAAALV